MGLLGLDGDLHVSSFLLSGFLVLNSAKLNAADVDAIVAGHLGGNILLALIGILVSVAGPQQDGQILGCIDESGGSIFIITSNELDGGEGGQTAAGEHDDVEE